MNDYEFGEIEKGVVALANELEKYSYVRFSWNISTYKELKWVQHHPVQYGIECAIKRIGIMLKKKERDKILRSVDIKPETAIRIARLWRSR